ncbi:hypothetical protein ACTJI8_20265 [Microbacterium sp. 22303]|uniref:hypothetical protein n=1 Tax=Microbacterium sp. 22303 TaxID=3453905 RepID=UPI003F827AC6
MSIIVVSAVVVVLITYGLVASLYWPVTAVSRDVWGAGYAQLEPSNIAGTVTAVFIWAALTALAGWGALRLSRGTSAIRGSAIALTLLGAAAILLYIPVVFASIAVYNVVPTTTDYPDRVTPIVVLAGIACLLAGGTISAIEALQERRRTHSANHSALPTPFTK